MPKVCKCEQAEFISLQPANPGGDGQKSQFKTEKKIQSGITCLTRLPPRLEFVRGC